MAQRGADVVRLGSDRLRVGPWRGDVRIACISPLPDAPPATCESIERCVRLLASRGYDEAVTAALAPTELEGFVAAGFSVRERLHLLVHHLDDLAPAVEAPLRRARQTDRAGVLSVDAKAFTPFWRLDDGGLDEALTATPVARFRVATGAEPGREVLGYAVVGRAGRRGYVQRLAVDPDHTGRGLGSALVLDGLHWLRRRAVSRVVVNTQEGNVHALALYERLGFRRQPAGLTVLRTALR